MRYFKYIDNHLIISIGIGNGGIEISETEYNEILTVVNNKPQKQGYGYLLHEDLTWEEYELEQEDLEQVVN